MIVLQLLRVRQLDYLLVSFELFVLMAWRPLISEKLVVVCLTRVEPIVAQLVKPALGSLSPVHHVSERLHVGFPKPSL